MTDKTFRDLTVGLRSKVFDLAAEYDDVRGTSAVPEDIRVRLTDLARTFAEGFGGDSLLTAEFDGEIYRKPEEDEDLTIRSYSSVVIIKYGRRDLLLVAFELAVEFNKLIARPELYSANQSHEPVNTEYDKIQLQVEYDLDDDVQLKSFFGDVANFIANQISMLRHEERWRYDPDDFVDDSVTQDGECDGDTDPDSYPDPRHNYLPASPAALRKILG